VLGNHKENFLASLTMANIKFDHFIDKFDGSNYHTWFTHMEMFSIEKNNGTVLMVL
jgi:hypothetical protein